MDLYFIIVALLFGLAIMDLIVGVSNDAVNFLNSAIGSRVATRTTIMIVVSCGIILGATFASGMMEVARKGIFNPQYFTFTEVMFIFLAVMLTDIILLDLFNTFALPTSTTVSIVFELLGASVAMALIKISANGESIASLDQYINSSSALAIIAGIFISVGIAFTIGAAVQYLTRLLLTFNVQAQQSFFGVLWSGLALAAITYFLLVKGLKSASFVPDTFKDWVGDHTLLLLIGSFLLLSGLVWLLHRRKVNPLRIVVLTGTFALAMAFAGNDLVNFIGVPLAGFESYEAWSGSGLLPDEMSMESLAAAYPARTSFLLLAGIIMVVTLWRSKKARSVTETEINLGRQSEGLERFASNRLSRGIVRLFFGLSRKSNGLVPPTWQKEIETRLTPPPPDPAAPAFDLVRASVNLTMASVLIAIATSYKLPLSTTYVSFMVAMGTSLADRAWGRDSAVYRIAGVLNVIGGWFMTAFIAFALAGLFAFLLHSFGIYAIAGLVALAVIFIVNTFRYHRRQEKKKEQLKVATQETEQADASMMITKTAQKITQNLSSTRQLFSASIDSLLLEDEETLTDNHKQLSQLREDNEDFQFIFHGVIRRLQEEHTQGSRTYLLAYDLQQDLLQSIEFIVKACHNYVADVLPPMRAEQADDFRRLQQQTSRFLKACEQAIQLRDFDDFHQLLDQKKQLLKQIDRDLSSQMAGIKAGTFGARNSMLYFSLMLETKDLLSIAMRLVKLYFHLENVMSPEEPYVLVTGIGEFKEIPK